MLRRDSIWMEHGDIVSPDLPRAVTLKVKLFLGLNQIPSQH